MSDGPFPPPDRLDVLRRATTARVALGRVGSAVPTKPALAFQLAQARARDAVHARLSIQELKQALQRPTLCVRSAAADREAYLQNPGLGRRVDAAASDRLAQEGLDLGVVLADGLSAGAVNRQGAALTHRLLDRLEGWTVAPVVLAEQARVAIGDDIGERLGVRFVVVMIGERPGLSAPESLGVYLTADPRPGRRDSERNCVSNVHAMGGLSLDQAAEKIAWLLQAARRLGFTGTALKDRQAVGPLATPAVPPLLEPPADPPQ